MIFSLIPLTLALFRFLSICSIDENNPSLTEVEAGLIVAILATYMMY